MRCPEIRLRLEVVRGGSLEIASPVTDSKAVFEAFRERFAGLHREEFWILCVDAKHRALACHLISIGSATSALVHPREVFKLPVVAESAECGDLNKQIFRRLIEASSVAVILVHNHPSGDPSPSPEDRQITRRLRDAGEVVGIRVLDHVVIGDGRFYSFVDNGAF